jgi:hypothetical protein
MTNLQSRTEVVAACFRFFFGCSPHFPGARCDAEGRKGQGSLTNGRANLPLFIIQHLHLSISTTYICLCLYLYLDLYLSYSLVIKQLCVFQNTTRRASSPPIHQHIGTTKNN